MSIKETKQALQVAKHWHRNQLRAVGPDTGRPYFDTHVLRVVHAVSGRAKPAAALHDVIEDNTEGVSVDGLRLTEQFSEITMQAVDLLTHRDDEPYGDYIDRILTAEGEAAFIAREVKLADLVDNLSTLPDGPLRLRYIRAISLIAASIYQTEPTQPWENLSW